MVLPLLPQTKEPPVEPPWLARHQRLLLPLFNRLAVGQRGLKLQREVENNSSLVLASRTLTVVLRAVGSRAESALAR